MLSRVPHTCNRWLASAMVVLGLVWQGHLLAQASLVQTVASANGGNDNTITATFASVPSNGSLLVAVLGLRGSAGTVTMPTGWIRAVEQSGSSPGQGIYYRIAGSSEPTGVTFGISTSGRLALHIYEYSGIPNAVFAGVVSNTGSGSTLSTGTVTTTGSNELLLAAATVNDGVGTSNSFTGWTNSFTEHNDLSNGGAAAFRSCYVGASWNAAAPGNYNTSVTAANPGPWIFQTARFLIGYMISGIVYEDVNFGGGAGRDRTTALANGGSGRPNARVELYDNSGAFLTSTTSNASGGYSIGPLSPGSYTVRVVNGTVSSARPGYVAGAHLAVQTFRTNATTGSPLAITDRVGGNMPERVDAGNGSTTLAALTTATTTAQTVTSIALGTANITNVDFGFNFDLVVNTLPSGQGSLEQFIINSNSLGNEAGLAQSGSFINSSGVLTSLPTGTETSIFMISNGSAHPGLRAGLVDQLTAGRALITPSTLTTIAGVRTRLDGTTQTANVGNTNSGTLGTGGTVGTDLVALGQVQAPELEVDMSITGNRAFNITSDLVTIRGFAILGAFAGGEGIQLTSGTSALVEMNLIGTRALAHTDPGAGKRNTSNIQSNGATNAIIRNNLISYSGTTGILVASGSNGWMITNNELQYNGLENTNGDGMAINTVTTAIVSNNLITGTSSQGLVLNTLTNSRFTNNTITNNGIGTASGMAQSAGITLRAGCSGLTFDRNLIASNYGAGLQINDGSSQIVITRNSFHSNGTIIAVNSAPITGQIGIDLNSPSDDTNFGTSPFVTINDNGDGDSGGNDLFNYPVLNTAYTQSGNLTVTGWARPGSLIEFFIADNDPRGFGEGQTYLFTATEGVADADATTGTYGPGAINGLAQGTDNTNRFSFSVPIPAGVTGGTRITATATVGNNTSEFSGVSTVSVLYALSGTVYEDVNYGGGAGRNKATAMGGGGTGRPNARVELYNSAGNFVTNTTTNASGDYVFNALAAGTYTVRVVNSTVSSARAGYLAGTHLAVQTFRTTATSGTAVSLTDRVGGASPNLVDAGNGSTTLAALTTASTTAQSLTPITIGSTDITGLDFGYNFDLIVNVNNAGQGSLRQFITNANALGDGSLAIQGQTAGRDVSLFMIADGTARPGLNTGMANLLTGGVAKIQLSSALPTINGTVTINGGLQTSLVGNTNPGTVGTGGTVGVDAIPLALFEKPEVEINAGDATGLTVNGNISDVIIESMAIFNASTGVLISGGTGTGNIVRNMFVGTTAMGTDPTGALRNTSVGINFGSPATGSVLRCYSAYNGLSAIGAGQPAATVVAEGNEVFGNGWNSNSHDGLDIDGDNCIFRYNLSYGTITNNGLPNAGGGNGIEVGSTTIVGAQNNLIENNTSRNNTSQGITVRSGANGNIISKNIFTGNDLGVLISKEGSIANNNQITQNSIFGNTGLGIDLSNAASNGDGVTANDGAFNGAQSNRGIDHPTITSAGVSAGNLTVSGYVGSAPNQSVFAALTVEFFKSDNDASGYGEGQTYLGSLVTDANGNFSGTFVVAGLATGNKITATATDGTLNTSEFGANKEVNLPPVAVCQNITITLDLTGTATITGNSVNNGSYDPDGTIASMTVSPNMFDCGSGGANAVILTVTDNLGSTATCNATVTVIVPDNDNDGVCDAEDLDDDNDGIPDLEEGLCTSSSIVDPYADVVILYEGQVGIAPFAADPTRALGAPDYDGIVSNNNPEEYVSMGTMGKLLVLGFTNNTIANSGDAADDIQVTEVGPAVESTIVWAKPLPASKILLDNQGLLTPDADGYYRIGIVAGAVYSLDIDDATSNAFAAGELQFNAIKLVSNVVSVNQATAGPDIDAVQGLYSFCASTDTDLDGIPDMFDLDSDNDGIYDVVEAGSGQAHTNGVLNGGVTANGIPISVDADANDVVDYTIRDSDSDGNYDFTELDSDNDGCSDVVEAGFIDTNGDGSPGNAPITVNPANGVVTSLGP